MYSAVTSFEGSVITSPLHPVHNGKLTAFMTSQAFLRLSTAEFPLPLQEWPHGEFFEPTSVTNPTTLDLSIQAGHGRRQLFGHKHGVLRKV